MKSKYRMISKGEYLTSFPDTIWPKRMFYALMKDDEIIKYFWFKSTALEAIKKAEASND